MGIGDWELVIFYGGLRIEKPGLLRILNPENPSFSFINPVSEQAARCVLINKRICNCSRNAPFGI